MKTTSRKKLVIQGFAKCSLAAAITLAAGLNIERAEASGIPVVDAAALLQRETSFEKAVADFAQTAAQYGKEIAHWEKTYEFWQTQLVKLQSLQFEIFSITQQYNEIALDYGVAERCPGVSADAISQLKSSIMSALTTAINADGNIVDRQNQICTAMVVAENKKYNFTVAYFKELDKQSSMLTQLAAIRASIGQSNANMGALSGDTGRYNAAMAKAKETWETNITQQDNEIAMLKQQQSIFARRAMNGQPTLIGSLVNAAVLKAALTVDK